MRARRDLNIRNFSTDLMRLAFVPHQGDRPRGRRRHVGYHNEGYGFPTSLVVQGLSVLTRPARVTFELDGSNELSARIDCLRMLRKVVQPSLMPRCHRLSVTGCAMR